MELDWFDDLWDGLVGRAPGKSVLLQRLEAERATQSAAFSEALKKLILGSGSGPTAAELLRSVAERDVWHVPVGEDGGLQAREERPGRYRLAVGERPGGKKDGAGGRLLRLYSTRPEGASREVSGRELIRSLPPDLDGLLLCEPPDAFVELRCEHLSGLEPLAASLDLEDLLTTPGPDQVERLLAAAWWTGLSPEGSVRVEKRYGEDERVVEVFTHPDQNPGGPALEPISGEELFRQVVRAPDCDGILANSYRSLGRGDSRIRGIAFGPALIHGFLAGEDRRPGAHPLPAQTREEVRQWLRLRRFPLADSRLIEAPLPSGTLVRAYREQGGPWRMQETLAEQQDTSETWSPVFELESPEAEGFGPKPSRILCPGLIAAELGALSHFHGDDPERLWSSGQWMLLGWKTDERGRALSRERLALARELEKLLPEGAAEIPVAACLTVRGAFVFRTNPRARTRDWILRTVRRAEQFTEGWVPGR